MATAAVTGTATPSIRKANIVAGGKTIIITLTGDTWVAAGGTFDAQRQNIINGIDSAQSEAAGWDAQVKANLAVTTVVRTSNTVVTVTLSAQAGYNATALETITVTVPSTAVTGAAQIVATPTFAVVPSPSNFYVGSGGADTNAGNTWATRRLTIQSAVTSANVPGDTVYVAPGTYRETVTFGASGSAGNVISLIGDYLGTNTSGTKGVVRITGAASETSWGTRNFCVDMTVSRNNLTIDGFLFDGWGTNGVAWPNGGMTGTTIKRCVFAAGANTNCIALSSLAASDSITIQQCFFWQRQSTGNANSAAIDFTASSALAITATVESCVFVGGDRQVFINRVDGIAVKNNTFMYGGNKGGVYIVAATAGTNVTVYNNLFFHNQIGVRGTITGEIVEDYNCFFDCGAARTNTATGTNSTTSPISFDTRPFFEMMNASGTLASVFDLAPFSAQVELNSGTGAPSTDLRGASQVGTYREWGALEYNPNLLIAGGGISRSRAVGGIG